MWFDKTRKRFDPITPEERAIVAGFREDFYRKYGKWIAPRGGGYSAGPAPEGAPKYPHPPKNPASTSTSRVGHYVTSAPALECSCGTALTHSAYASLTDIINAAIAHGIDVERGRN